ncbi:MAG: hypothetical protein ACK55Z_03265, partial [bacterium]
SNSDWSTFVPKASRGAPATAVQNEADQATSDDDTVTHVVEQAVQQAVQQIMQKTANKVERLGFCVIVPA